MNITKPLDTLDYLPVTRTPTPAILTPEQKKAGHIILKKWRYKKLHKFTTTPLPDDMALNLTMEKRNLQRVCTTRTIPRPERGVYEINREKAKEWVNDHPIEYRPLAEQFISCLTYKSHEKFEKQLRLTINDFNRHLLSRPSNQRNYAIFVDSIDSLKRSEGWVQLLALKYLMTDTLMFITDAVPSLPKKPDLILVCDDGAYSGSQMSITARRLLHVADVFIAVPFMSQTAKNTIRQATNQVGNHKLQFCAHQIMPTFKELNFTRNPFRDKEKTQLRMCFPHHCSTIFNHKIADSVSIPHEIIKYGHTLLGKSRKTSFLNHAQKLPPYKTHSKL